MVPFNFNLLAVVTAEVQSSPSYWVVPSYATSPVLVLALASSSVDLYYGKIMDGRHYLDIIKRLSSKCKTSMSSDSAPAASAYFSREQAAGTSLRIPGVGSPGMF